MHMDWALLIVAYTEVMYSENKLSFSQHHISRLLYSQHLVLFRTHQLNDSTKM